MAKHRTRQAARPGERLVVAGAVVFLAGVVAVGAVFVPFLYGRAERGVPLSLASFLTSAGLGLALAGLVRQARARRDVAAAATQPGRSETVTPRPASQSRPAAS